MPTLENGTISKKTPYNGCFKNLDTPEKVYWFGFIVGDGSIGHYGSHYEFYVSSIDKEHLEKLVLFLGYPINRVTRKKTGIYKFHIAQKEMVNDLMLLGLTQRKTHNLTGSIIPEKYKWDFIRGLFDADGCLYLNNGNSYLNPKFTITGKYFLLNAVKAIINNDGCLFIKDKATYLSYGGRKKVTNILNKLYCGTPYLNRKYELYNELKKYNTINQFGARRNKKYTIYKKGQSYLETIC